MVGVVGDDGGDEAGRDHGVVGGVGRRGSRAGRALPRVAAVVVHVDTGHTEVTVTTQ